MTSTLRAVTAPAEAAERRHAELQNLRVAMLGVLAVTLPLALGQVAWSKAGGSDDYLQRVTIAPFDIAVLLLIVAAIAERRRPPPLRDFSIAVRIAALFGVALLFSLVMHPSPRGVDLAVRIVGMLAVVDAIRMLDSRGRRVVVGIFAAVGAFEALIGLAQAAKGGAIGISVLELDGEFYRFGTSTAARGGLSHPYALACFCLVAIAAALLGTRGTLRHQAPWLVAAGVCAMCVATTYSRAGLVSIAAVVVLAAVGPRDVTRRKAVRTVAAVVALGFVVGALSFGNGWWSRSEGLSSQGGKLDNVDTGRGERAREAFRLIDTHPVTGVGLGRYVIALDSIDHQEGIFLPAHNIALHAAAEAGIVAGLLAAALAVAITVRYLRAGAFAMAIFCSLALYFLVDSYPYLFPTGLALIGFWLGFLEIARREHRDSRHEPSMAHAQG